jgi:prepilin-type N-terminal cleavage/methylation domain-containing protein
MERHRSRGFTLIELLIVVAIIGLIASVTLPISYQMIQNYETSLKAEEVMLFISGIRRESFLYSEYQTLSSEAGGVSVNGQTKVFKDVRIEISTPIEFYQNGTTSGGIIKIKGERGNFTLDVQAPFGDMALIRNVS